MNLTNLQGFSDELAEVTERTLRSVVTVMVMPGRAVSGVVVGPQEVLTVDHVLHQDEVRVRDADGERHAGLVLGRDAVTDLALLRVEGLDAPPLPPGSGQEADGRLGELVLAVARPAGGPMVTVGVLSGTVHAARGPGRRPRGGAGRGAWLLASAAPYPGFSGSALVSASGALLGVNNAGVSRGELLAVQANRAAQVAQSLASGGSVQRGYLGVATQPARLPGGEVGLIVVSVDDGSPAQQSGMLLGDVLISWNGESLGGPAALLEYVAHGAGQTARVGIVRGGEARELNVTLGVRER